ncbi:hypothetical protein BDW22DRAFT_1357143 [Trametopsis cervina]|nr:hypothetical protein BDW22DRAFT_1357143 [Trametopsis cervina]
MPFDSGVSASDTVMASTPSDTVMETTPSPPSSPVSLSSGPRTPPSPSSTTSEHSMLLEKTMQAQFSVDITRTLSGSISYPDSGAVHTSRLVASIGSTQEQPSLGKTGRYVGHSQEHEVDTSSASHEVEGKLLEIARQLRAQDTAEPYVLPCSEEEFRVYLETSELKGIHLRWFRKDNKSAYLYMPSVSHEAITHLLMRHILLPSDEYVIVGQHEQSGPAVHIQADNAIQFQETSLTHTSSTKTRSVTIKAKPPGTRGNSRDTSSASRIAASPYDSWFIKRKASRAVPASVPPPPMFVTRIVAEVAVSQPLEQALEKARLWLAPAESSINVVIVLAAQESPAFRSPSKLRHLPAPNADWQLRETMQTLPDTLGPCIHILGSAAPDTSLTDDEQLLMSSYEWQPLEQTGTWVWHHRVEEVTAYLCYRDEQEKISLITLDDDDVPIQRVKALRIPWTKIDPLHPRAQAGEDLEFGLPNLVFWVNEFIRQRAVDRFLNWVARKE